MPALHDPQRTAGASETTTVRRLRLVRAATAPALARLHVQSELAASVTAGRLHDLVLLTSEVVTNAVQHSRAGTIEISVVAGTTFTRIEVGNPGQSWDRRPEPRESGLDEAGGWGLFLVEQLSDRWDVSDSDHTVWFEFDHPEGAVAVSDDLFGRRAESNQSVVAIIAEPCERCGFPRTAGEAHSCLEEKALFAESVNGVTSTFERFDESTARQAVSEDIRIGVDRRRHSTRIGRTEERRHPPRRADGRAGAFVDNGGQRREARRDSG